jgi:NAD(P)-dependent dehydrogenase (short-subunit alcohol dehydrogenase family)
VAYDVSDQSQVINLAETVAAKHGQIDILVNNAGIQPFGPMLDEERTEDFQHVLDVNVKGVFLSLKHAPEHMPDGASIINTASVSGYFAMPGVAKYSVSKGAILNLSQAGAVELAPRGIRVSSVCPGITLTPVVTEDPIEGNQVFRQGGAARAVRTARRNCCCLSLPGVARRLLCHRPDVCHRWRAHQCLACPTVRPDVRGRESSIRAGAEFCRADRQRCRRGAICTRLATRNRTRPLKGRGRK